MHFFKSFLFIALVSLFISCGNDDETSIDESELVATWQLTAFDFAGASIPTPQDEASVIAIFNGEGLNFGSTFTFDGDPNIFKANGIFDIALTTSIDGEITSETVTSEEFALAFKEDGSWSIDEAQLTIIGNNGAVANFEITALTSNILVLEFSEEVSIETDGMSQPSLVIITYTFTIQ